MRQVEASVAPSVARRAFFDANRDQATRLLLDLALQWREDGELWRDLGFFHKSEQFAADWCVKQWCSADWSELPRPGAGQSDTSAQFAAVVASHWFGALGLRLEVFGMSKAWIQLRLLDLGARDLQRGARPKLESSVTARTTSRSSDGTSSRDVDVTDRQVASDYLRYGRDVAVDAATVLNYAKELTSMLHRFGAATHRGLEAAWFAHHEHLADFLGRLALAAGMSWDNADDAALPPDYHGAGPSDRNKVRALAAFRFLVFRDDLIGDAPDLATAAFQATYLADLGKPTWAKLTKDRWDVVPKRVVAEQLRGRFPQGSPNVVSEAARTRLAELMGEAMKLYRRRATQSQGGFTDLADIIHACDSVTATLRHEIPRNASVGPSAEAIERWRGDLNDAARAVAEAES
jgi:hypothetical protein